MKKVLEVTDSLFLNKFNFDLLDCYARPRCIISEHISKNSMFYYLLFSDYQTVMFDKSYETFLEEKTNIKFPISHGKSEDFHKELMEYIDKGIPVIAAVNIYYDSEHHIYYNIQHHIHFTIIKGYNTETKEYYIIDEQPPNRQISSISNDTIYLEKTIPMDKLYMLATTVDQIENIEQKAGVDYTDFYLFNHLSYDSSNVSMFSIIDLLGEYKQHLNAMIEKAKWFEGVLGEQILLYKSNLPNYVIGINVIGIKELQQILLHIYSLSSQEKVLNYLLSESDKKQELMEQFNHLNTRYRKIRAILIKSSYNKDGSKCDYIIEKYLRNISEEEISLYRTIIDVLGKYIDGKSNAQEYFLHDIRSSIDPDIAGTNQSDAAKTEAAKEIEETVKMGVKTLDYVNVDLREHFNNKGVCHGEDQIDGQDFDGLSRCYYGKGFHQDDIWEYNHVTFKTNFFEGGYDNISCLGQTIKCNGNSYDNIMIMGSCAFSSYCDKIKLHFEDGVIEEILIRFTDWVMIPQYNETLMWSGTQGRIREEQLHFSSYINVHIFANTYAISNGGKLVSIELPHCLDLHIFAITLS